MLKKRTFHSIEFGFFDEKHQSWVAVSVSFNLVAEGKSKTQAQTRLREAIAAYLSVCIEDDEPDEQVYRTPPKKLMCLFQQILSENIAQTPDPKTPKRRYVSENSSYAPRMLAATA